MLTDSQRALFEKLRPDRYTPSADQTFEQARNASADGFVLACSLADEPPALEDVLAEMDRRAGE